MATDAAANVGTTAVRPGYEIDTARLEAWLERHVEGFAGPLAIEQFKGGQSNPTYRLVTPRQSYVLRRKPPGPVLKGAHAVEREARVMRALGEAGLPVPRIHALCTCDAVIGSWFVVMDMIDGRIFWDATLPEVARPDRAAHFDVMNETLARLHGLDPDAVGLGDYGRRGNYFERQISRWARQYIGDTDGGRDPNMDRLIEWLPAHIPQDGDETRIIHGDYRIDNLVFHPVEPRVVAILDWELSTLGHPLADFAYHAMMYRTPPHIVAGLWGADLPRLGIPAEEEYVDAYCRRTGRHSIPGISFYFAFNFFRLAAIFHGIRGRVARGNAASAHAAARAAAFPELAELAWQYAQSAES